MQKKLQNLQSQSQSLKAVITRTEIIEQPKTFGYVDQDIMSAIDILSSSVDKSNFNDIRKLMKQKEHKEHTMP